MATEIHLKQWGEHLGSRWLGMQIRALIEPAMVGSRAHVVIDGSGVESMSHSFADECFGKLAEAHGIRAVQRTITLANLSPDCASAIRYVIDSRSRRSCV